MKSEERLELRTIVRATYDAQRIRIALGHRLVAMFAAKLGQNEAKPRQEDLSAEDQKLLKDLKARHKRLSDALAAENPGKRRKHPALPPDEVVTSFVEFEFIGAYTDMEKVEQRYVGIIGSLVEPQPLWTTWLKDVKGIGLQLTGVLLAEFDFTKMTYPSSAWKLAGLDVAGDGKGRSRRKEHLVEKVITGRDGKQKTIQGLSYNPWLRSKLLGTLMPCLLRANSDPYAQIYRDYKHRLEHHVTYSTVSAGHRHAMARRYACKEFLKDLYRHGRGLMGLPIAPTYAEAKLGIVHHEGPGPRADGNATPPVIERAKTLPTPNPSERDAFDPLA